MNGLRARRVQGIGAGVASLALYLQLVFATWCALMLAAHANPLGIYGEHALCLAGEAKASQRSGPGGAAPSPGSCGHGWCCPLHQVTGIQPRLTLVPQPANFECIARLGAGEPRFIPLQRTDLANARAPPLSS